MQSYYGYIGKAVGIQFSYDTNKDEYIRRQRNSYLRNSLGIKFPKSSNIELKLYP